MRPTLKLKNRSTAPVAATSIIAAVEPPAQAAESPKASKAAKEARANANRLLNEEQKSLRAAQMLKLEPVVRNYLLNQPLVRDTVLLDGVEYLRPLAIGVHKTILAYLRSLPEAENCSNTVINALVKSVMEAHVAKLQYRQGLLKFPHRFNLDGSQADIIGDKQRAIIQKLLNKLKACD